MALANAVKFSPLSGTTADFVYSATVTGFRAPSVLTDGAVYSYRAESADMVQWEIGTGAWTSATSTLARTTVIASSTGAKVNFSTTPTVGIVALAEDIAPPGAEYLVKTADSVLSAERVVTDNSMAGGLVSDWGTAGQWKGALYASATGKFLYSTGANQWAEATITAAGLALLDDADAAAQRTTLGLGTAATVDTGTSGATIPLLNAANTWGASQTITGSLSLNSTTAYNPQISATHTGDTAGSAGYVLLNRARAGSTDVQAGDALGTFGAQGWFNGAMRLAGYFAWSVDGAPSGSTVYPKLVYTIVGVGSVFAIDKDGNTGIGTTTPGAKLDVVGATKTTTIELGHATDTTITRAAAGDIAVEGNTIYRVGGTDVAVADGGTGASTLAANAVLLGNGTSALQTVAPSTSGNVLTSNGTTWNSVAPAASGGKAADQQVFTSSGTWTKPSGYGAKAMALIQCWGGGGGGGRFSTATSATGGGGGGYNELIILLSSLGATETVTIGAGGAGRTGSSGSGTAGGDTTFGSLLIGYGGGGGGGDGGNGVGTGGSHLSAGVTSTLSYPVMSVWNAVSSVMAATSSVPHLWSGGNGKGPTTSVTANALMGGGGGGYVSSTAGGTSFGGGAGGTSAATPGNGAQPGGGGASSTVANTNGGNGGAGKCVVTVFDGA